MNKRAESLCGTKQGQVKSGRANRPDKLKDKLQKQIRRAIIRHDKANGGDTYIPCHCTNCEKLRAELLKLKTKP